jgi:hypothetical protein
MRHFYLAAFAAVSLATSASAATTHSVVLKAGSVVVAPATVPHETPNSLTGSTLAFEEVSFFTVTHCLLGVAGTKCTIQSEASVHAGRDDFVQSSAEWKDWMV